MSEEQTLAVDPTSGTPAAERSKSLGRNVVAGLLGRVVNMTAALFTVPLTLAALGPLGYGVFQTITSVSSWVNLGSLGLGKGLLNGLVESRAHGDVASARQQIASYVAGITGVMLVAGIAFALAFPWVPWESVFPTTDATHQAAVPLTVALTVGFTGFALILSFVGIAFSAYQKENRSSALSAIRGIGMIAGLALAVAAGGGMPTVALATGVISALASIGGLIWLLVEEPSLRFRARDVSVPLLRSLVSKSVLFFAIDVAAILVFALDRLIILHVAGAEDVAAFDLVARLFTFGYASYQVVLSPLWPAFGDAIHRRDYDWTRRMLKKVSTLAVAGAVALMLGALLLGRPILALWTGRSDIAFTPFLALGVGAFFVVRAWTDAHTMLLYSANRPGEVLASAVVHGLLSLALAVTLGSIYGVEGVVAGNFLAFAASAGWWVPLRARRHLEAMA